jgi:uncharacterized protein (DUF1697 family)
MTTYVALLRAVNVGGTGKLPMSALRAMCLDAGFTCVETYIASGNVVFDSRVSPAKVTAELTARLLAFAGAPIGVLVRTAAEMAVLLRDNPFPHTDPKLTYAIFLDRPPPSDTLAHVSGRREEEIRLGRREIYVYYPGGMGRSRLRIPAARAGTARNMNTVAKLADIASRL